MSATPNGARSTVAAFFDVDGTLCDTTIVHYYRYFMFRRLHGLPRRIWYAAFLAKCGYYLLLDKIDRARLNVAFYKNYAGLPAPATRSQARECFREVIVPRSFPQAAQCVAEHRRRDEAVVFVTGSLDFIMAPLAEQLGASHVIASHLLEENGCFTGRLAAPPIGGEEKSRLAREYAAEHGIDLAQSYAYGDSMADLPMLEAVGFPNAVNPDRGLTALATARGWPIHRWTTENAKRPA